jgi:2-dehydro-3-deoxyphosphooctonate aldolase (KDO 8-P synthase)
MAAGVDGIFMETHENPAKAPSDGPNQISHKDLPTVLKSLLSIHRALA